MVELECYLFQFIIKFEGCFEENGFCQDFIVMCMIGCFNGCVCFWFVEVVFVGKVYGVYNMYLGGGYYGQRFNKFFWLSIKEDEIFDIMKLLLKRYFFERQEGERFGDFCVRSGVIVVIMDGQNFYDNVSFYFFL